jgi:hypothetical protein
MAGNACCSVVMLVMSWWSRSRSVQTGSGAYRASFPNGTEGSFARGQRPVREAVHSPPSSAEIKNGEAILPLPYMSSWNGA